MKRKIFFTAPLLFTFLAFKSTGTDMVVKKTVSGMRPGFIDTYSYTADGKISGHQRYFSGMWETYQYSKRKGEEQRGNFTNGVTQQITYYLNPKGYAHSSETNTRDTLTGQVMGAAWCTHYKYDKDGFLIEQRSGCGKRTLEVKQIIEGGNVIKRIHYMNGKEHSYNSFEYYSDKPDMKGGGNSRYPFLGKASKNLLKRWVMVFYPNDTVSSYLHQYQFDSQQRVTFDIVYGRFGELVDSVQYFY